MRILSRFLGQHAGADLGFSMQCLGPLVAATALDANGFIVPTAMRVAAIKGAWTVVGGSGAKCFVRKCTGTQAPSAGTTIISATAATGFNSDGSFDLTSAVNTVRTGLLAATEATLRLASGDRIALDFAGTLTGLEGFLVQVHLLPLPDVHYHIAD